jgi:HSP20 family protein
LSSREVKVMAIVRWNALTPLAYFGLRPRNRFWYEFGEFPLVPSSDWGPSTDIYSEDEDLVVKMDLPEMNSEEVDVHLEGTDLTISGRHEREEKEETKEYYRKERFVGSFSRRIPLPHEVKDEDIKANLKEGVLEVRVKGAATAIPAAKKIAIESS